MLSHKALQKILKVVFLILSTDLTCMMRLNFFFSKVGISVLNKLVFGGGIRNIMIRLGLKLAYNSQFGYVTPNS